MKVTIDIDSEFLDEYIVNELEEALHDFEESYDQVLNTDSDRFYLPTFSYDRDEEIYMLERNIEAFKVVIGHFKIPS